MYNQYTTPTEPAGFLTALREIATLLAEDTDNCYGSDQLLLTEDLIAQLPTPIPNHLLAAAWATVQGIEQEDWRAAALAVLAYHASAERQDDLYPAIFDLLDSLDWAYLPLIYIVHYALPKRFHDQARVIAEGIADARERAEALEELEDHDTGAE